MFSTPLDEDGQRWTLRRGYQWLTDEDSWQQIWATRNHISVDRTEVRFTVAIPKASRDRLIRWRDLATTLPPLWVETLARPGDEHWFIYRGNIPAGWLRRRESRPGAIAA